MAEDGRPPELSRRGLGVFLGKVGGAAGVAALAGCLNDAKAAPEETATSPSALTGSGGNALAPCFLQDADGVATLDRGGLLPAGFVIYISSLRSYFMLDRQSTLTPDGVYVIAAAAGGGNWVRLPQGDASGHVVVPSGQSIFQTQGGTVSSPTNETLWAVQPVDPTKAAFSVNLQSVLFNSTHDYVQKIGYNAFGLVSNEPEAYWALESDFEYAPGGHKLECYLQTSLSPSSPAYRPSGFVLDRVSGAVTTSLQYAGASFVLLGGPIGGPPAQQWYVADGVFEFVPDPYVIVASGALNLSTPPNKQLQISSGGQLNVLAGSGSLLFLAGDSIAIAQANTVQHATIDNNVSNTRFYPTTDNTGSIGLEAKRWSAIHGVTITSGDLHLEDKERGAEWLLREQPTFILAVNQRTGERRKLLTAPLTDEDERELRENDPEWSDKGAKARSPKKKPRRARKPSKSTSKRS